MNRPTYHFCLVSLVNGSELKKHTAIRWNLWLIADSSNKDIFVGRDKITHMNEPIAIAMRTTGRKSGERMIAAVGNDGRSGWWNSWDSRQVPQIRVGEKRVILGKSQSRQSSVYWKVVDGDLCALYGQLQSGAKRGGKVLYNCSGMMI